jgi:hypothetical protein
MMTDAPATARIAFELGGFLGNAGIFFTLVADHLWCRRTGNG